jgi:tricarballylate dehydrogenase
VVSRQKASKPAPRNSHLFIPGLYPPYQAETLDGLAQQAGLPLYALERTIRQFNPSVPADPPFDHGRLNGRSTTGLNIPKSNWAPRIDSPPFYPNLA